MGLTGSPTNNSSAELTQIVNILRGSVEDSQVYPDQLPLFTIRRLKTDSFKGQKLTHPTPGICGLPK